MATTPESRVKARVRKLLDLRGAYVHCPMTHGYGASGVHDIFALYKGVLISIETKALPKNKPTGLQTKHAKMVHEAGGCVALIHAENVEVVNTILDMIDEHAKVTKHFQYTEWPNGFVYGRMVLPTAEIVCPTKT